MGNAEEVVGEHSGTDKQFEALPAFSQDFQPLTDMRASKEYRMLAAQNLLRRFQLETTGVAERLSKAVA